VTDFSKSLAALAAVAWFTTTQAHHSAGMFDMTKQVTISGTVKEFQYSNPHSWLQVMLMGKDGTPVLYAFETGAPTMLERMGIKLDTFKPGEKVTVAYNPMRDGRPAGLLKSVTKADGSVYPHKP
jgi:Family of unknown function (DUF6152)